MRIFVIFFTIVSSTVAFPQRKKATQNTLRTQEDTVKFESILIEAEKQLILENHAKALESFHLALTMNPQSAAASFKISEVLLKSKQGQRAIPFARKATELDPDNKYYWLSLARLYTGIGFFIDAIKTYKALLTRFPSEENSLYELAELYQNLGKTEEMLKMFDLIEEQLGVKTEIIRERQRIFTNRGDFEGVLNEYYKLINTYPYETTYRVELISILLQKNKLELAEKEIQEYEKAKHTSSRILLLKSELNWLKGDRSLALEQINEAFGSKTIDFATKFKILTNYLALTNKPDQTKILADIAVKLAGQYPDEYKAQAFVGDLLYQQGKKENALDFYLRTIEMNPANYSVWQNIINIESELNDYEHVILHAEEALKYFPNQAVLYYFAGTGYLVQKEYHKSKRMLEQGKKYTIDPELLTVFYGQLGDAYNGMEDHEKSFNSYEKSLQNKPDNDHVLNNYSYFLSLKKKDMDKALSMSTKLVEQHPNNPTYLDTHGWVLYVSGDFKESKKFLEKASSLDNDGTILEHLGDVLYKLGDIDGALKKWEKARELGDASENIDKKIADRMLYE